MLSSFKAIGASDSSPAAACGCSARLCQLDAATDAVAFASTAEDEGLVVLLARPKVMSERDSVTDYLQDSVGDSDAHGCSNAAGRAHVEYAPALSANVTFGIVIVGKLVRGVQGLTLPASPRCPCEGEVLVPLARLDPLCECARSVPCDGAELGILDRGERAGLAIIFE